MQRYGIIMKCNNTLHENDAIHLWISKHHHLVLSLPTAVRCDEFKSLCFTAEEIEMQMNYQNCPKAVSD